MAGRWAADGWRFDKLSAREGSPFHILSADPEALALRDAQPRSGTRTNGFASRTVRSVVLPSALPRPCVWLWGGVA
jgi:hypothetical protein